MSGGIPYERAVKEDLELGYGTVSRSMPAGGSATGNKIGIHTFLGPAYLNVRDFGALGDGYADDTAPIQSAIDACIAAGGGVVFFPTGRYRITAPLIVQSTANSFGSSNGLALRGGSGYSSRIIQASASTDIFQVGAVTDEVGDSIVIEDMWLEPTRYGLHLAGCLGSCFERLRIVGGVSAIYFKGMNESLLLRDLVLTSQSGRAIDAKGNVDGGTVADPLALPEIQKQVWENILIIGCDGPYAIDIAGGSLGGQQSSGDISITGVVLESCSQSFVRIGYAFNTSIDGLSNENNTTTSNTYDVIRLDAGAGAVALKNCHLAGRANDGSTYKYCINQIDGIVTLINVTTGVVGAAGTLDVRLAGGGGTIVDAIISSAAAIAISGTAATQTRIVSLRDTTGAFLQARNQGSVTPLNDGATIAHGLSFTPNFASAIPTTGDVLIGITALDATNITLAIKNRSDGSAASGKAVYWEARSVYAP